jgi:hypothetical protein
MQKFSMRFSLPGKLALVVWCGILVSSAWADDGPAAAGKAGRPPLLHDAFTAFLGQQGRWAFTETHSGVGLSGKPSGETIEKIDPSLPYAQQFTPIKVIGHPPTEKQLKQASQKGEKAAKRVAQQIEEQKTRPADEDFHLVLHGRKVTPDLEQARMLTEDATSVTYEVPMRTGSGSDDAFFDKFTLTARVNKTRREFEHATLRQRSPMRVKLIFKVTDGLIEIEFKAPDARYPSVPIKFSSKATVSVLFGKPRQLHDEGVRTELKHVTPYDERFGVKVGPMRTIEL